ncbi:E3 ubiquitin-protein ligase CHIP isoform X2 [Diaphorina citri]|uniref:E3 ubiquitin-protein ligase CHIP n=1 Tax=Diaphorina citri TaxID=121845 RepID=A0A1S3D5Z3_DIACI|nr:E3 ubiquitin-protein ligase CHIP isoform X1 [Diaphorina citri]XP_008474198.1 E3 ubiquitin-protein ligase CHIP isoform X2 [Diaphorina citri]
MTSFLSYLLKMSKSHNFTTNNLSDKELKDEGNRYFGLRQYEEAINCYTRAIIKNPVIPSYFTNRALCYLKLKQYVHCCDDCRKALELEPSLVKAQFFLGQALHEINHYDEAVKHLQRAYDLSREQNLNYGDDIACQLRIAKKKRWAETEEKRIAQEIELLTYLNRLITEDAEKELGSIRRDAETKRLDGDAVQEAVMRIEARRDRSMAELNDLFVAIDERRRKREVPDYLCGKISFEILRDPVITPSGITYERKNIEEHLQKVGHFDPVTRVKLSADQLIPNFAMKEVVDNFLQENDWAYEY